MSSRESRQRNIRENVTGPVPKILFASNFLYNQFNSKLMKEHWTQEPKDTVLRETPNS